MPKIVDCFIFYNELELLEYRLSILYDVVDYFVICEASKTFVGNPKPFYYNENRDRYSRFSDKIIHIMMNDDDTNWIKNTDSTKEEQWINESTHRNGISRGVDLLLKSGSISNDDLITICDLDEIPNPELLKYLSGVENIHSMMTHEGGAVIVMDFYYYNLNCIHASNKWKLAKIVTVSSLINNFKFTPQLLRHYNFSVNIKSGGWHLSYFGDENFIKNKITNFSHQELNMDKFTDIEKIRERVVNNKDLYDRPNEKWRYISFEENTFLPPNWSNFTFFTNGLIKSK
jgi:beta-1,4-mannosyl-glycoprotein beta-1,4-N-acetylglucosaminyltransferase